LASPPAVGIITRAPKTSNKQPPTLHWSPKQAPLELSAADSPPSQIFFNFSPFTHQRRLTTTTTSNFLPSSTTTYPSPIPSNKLDKSTQHPKRYILTPISQVLPHHFSSVYKSEVV
jgi:hypothetical protein